MVGYCAAQPMQSQKAVSAYLLTYKVSRCCILALHGSMARLNNDVQLFNANPSSNVILYYASPLFLSIYRLPGYFSFRYVPVPKC